MSTPQDSLQQSQTTSTEFSESTSLPVVPAQQVVSRLFEDGYLVTSDVMKLVKQGLSYQTIKQLLTKAESAASAAASRLVHSVTFDESHVAVNIVKSYVDSHKEVLVQDFVNHFHARLLKLSAILRRRSELENVTSINRILQKTAQEKVSLIGLVREKSETKNGHISLTIEDKTGEIKVLVLKRDNKSEVYDIARNVVFDDVIGVLGSNTLKDGRKDGVIFADSILYPEIPQGGEFKKCPDDVAVAFLGDLHIGSKHFLGDEFNDFLDWINQKSPDPQKNALAAKIRYIVAVGDIIEGAGIYPGQEEDLEMIDVKDQYKRAAELFAKIPKHIHVIVCPGNHDTMRLSEPQPPLSKEYAKDFVELPNVITVSSPSFINIHKYNEFPGFNILLYHGYSFFYYINSVEEIRKVDGIKHIDTVMEFLLRRRHLAPSHTSNLYLPDPDRDELVIETVPDFFASGHIHTLAARNYKNVTILNCSCFVNVTDYQKKQGMVPDLAKVPYVNLKTREVKIFDFLHEENQIKEIKGDS